MSVRPRSSIIVPWRQRPRAAARRGANDDATSTVSSPGTRMRLKRITGASTGFVASSPILAPTPSRVEGSSREPGARDDDEIAVGLKARRHRPFDLAPDRGCRRPRRPRSPASRRNARQRRRGSRSWPRPRGAAQLDDEVIAAHAAPRQMHVERRWESCAADARSSVASRGMAPSIRCSSPPPLMV